MSKYVNFQASERAGYLIFAPQRVDGHRGSP